MSAKTAAPGRGRPRSEASRGAIIAAANQLLRGVGLRRMTVEAVAELSGVGKATIYRWWPSKGTLALDAYLRLGRLPPSVESHELKAKIASERRQFAEAAKEWKGALDLSPGNTYVEKQLGIALYKSGDVAGAQVLFEALLKHQPGAPDLNFYLGDTLLHAQKPQDALPFLQKALVRDPALLPAQQAIGMAYIQTGQAAKAVPHLKAALPIDEDGSLHYQLARAYQITGEKERASAMLREYREKQQAQQKENAAVEKQVALTPPP